MAIIDQGWPTLALQHKFLLVAFSDLETAATINSFFAVTVDGNN